MDTTKRKQSSISSSLDLMIPPIPLQLRRWRSTMNTRTYRGAAFALIEHRKHSSSSSFYCAHHPARNASVIQETVRKKSTTPSTQACSESATIATQEVSSTPNPTATPQQTPTTVAQATSYSTCQQPCTGTSKVFFNSEYSKWIKVVLCSPSRYDILIGENQQVPC